MRLCRLDLATKAASILEELAMNNKAFGELRQNVEIFAEASSMFWLP